MTTPNHEKCIALARVSYDRMVSDIRTGRHSERHPLRHKFNGDEFTTLIWMEGDTVWARDPEHGRRRIQPMDPQTITRDVNIGAFKGFVIAALCEADVPFEIAAEIGVHFKHICSTVDELDDENPLRETLYHMTLAKAAIMAGIDLPKMKEAVSRIAERQRQMEKPTQTID